MDKSKEYFNIAKQKEELGLYREALEYYKKSIEEDNDNIEAYFSLNLVNSYIGLDSIDEDMEESKKHIELLNVFNDILNKK